MEFMGYIRPDGSVGVRNHVLIVSCGAKTDRLAFNITNTVAETIAVYCGSFNEHPDYSLILGLAGNPNVAGAVVLETFPGDGSKSVKNALAESGKPYEFINPYDCGGTLTALFKATRTAAGMVREISTYRRQIVSVSRLLTGLIYVEDKQVEGPLFHFMDSMVSNNSRLLGFQPNRGKKDALAGYGAMATISRGQRIPKAQGLYVIHGALDFQGALLDMVFAGAQVVVSNSGSLYQNSILPIINMVSDHNTFKSFQDDLEMELIISEDRYKIEDYSLLIVNEVIATASGKLTKSEILKS